MQHLIIHLYHHHVVVVLKTNEIYAKIHVIHEAIMHEFIYKQIPANI
jgi:hypothetical protein